jgi:hypothetical protein
LKKSKFDELTSLWGEDEKETGKIAWNHLLKSVIAKIKYKNRVFEHSWQHEDIDYLIEELQAMKVNGKNYE